MRHPTIHRLVIFALADMSHGVKKITNSVEKGDLRGIENYPINIYMLRDCYMETPDMKTNGESNLIILPKIVHCMELILTYIYEQVKSCVILN